MAAELLPKFSVHDEHSESDCTFHFRDEDHTLGNALRYTLMRDEAVAFCGYNVPHPNEPMLHLRLQTKGEPTLVVLKRGLTTLMGLCDHMTTTVAAAVQEAQDESPLA